MTCSMLHTQFVVDPEVKALSSLSFFSVAFLSFPAPSVIVPNMSLKKENERDLLLSTNNNTI